MKPDKMVRLAIVIAIIALSSLLSARAASVPMREPSSIVTGMPKAAQERLKIIWGD